METGQYLSIMDPEEQMSHHPLLQPESSNPMLGEDSFLSVNSGANVMFSSNADDVIFGSSESNFCFEDTMGEFLFYNLPAPQETSTAIPVQVIEPVHSMGTPIITPLVTTMVLQNFEQDLSIPDNLLYTNCDQEVVEEFLPSSNILDVEIHEDNKSVHSFDSSSRLSDLSVKEFDETLGNNFTPIEYDEKSISDKKRSKSPSSKFLLVDTEGPETIYTCRLCGVQFSMWKAYKVHFSEHVNDKYFKCLHCDESFNREGNLKLHASIHNTENGLVCPACYKRFGRLASLKSHIKFHEEDETLICNVCDEEFTSIACLEFHIDEHTATDPTKQKVFICKTCSHTFPNTQSYKEHLKEHTKIKKVLTDRCHKKKKRSSRRVGPYQCKVCQKCFLKPSQLTRHQRIHTGEKPYNCGLCNRGFNQKNSLQVHMMKHSGDRPFPCTFCNSSFSQKGNLRAHVLRVHSLPKREERVYKCSECTCMFRKISNLNSHKAKFHLHTEVPTSVKNSASTAENTGMVEITYNTDCVKRVSIAVGSDDNSETCYQDILIENRAGTPIYICILCRKEYLKFNEMCKHMKMHVVRKPFLCHHCGRRFSFKETYFTHLKLHKTESSHRCNICTETFATNANLLNHKKLHDNDDNNGPVMNFHIQMASVTDRTVNENSKTSDLSQVQAEILVNKVNLVRPPYVCKLCDITFENYGKLKNHKQRKHSVAENNADVEDIESRELSDGELSEHKLSMYRDTYKCNECGKKYSRRNGLTRHVKSHLEYKSFVCSVCHKVFQSLNRCKWHMKMNHSVQLSTEVLEICSVKNKVGNVVEYHTSNDTNNIRSNPLLLTSALPNSGDQNTSENITSCNNIISSSAVNESDVSFPTVSVIVSNKFPLQNIAMGANMISTSDSQQAALISIPDTMENYLFSLQQASEVQSTPSVLSLIQSDDLINDNLQLIYRCLCGQCFTSENKLITHQEQSKTCSINGILSGAVLKNATIFYSCNVCSLTFNCTKTFCTHTMTHVNNRMYACIYCSELSFKSQTLLQEHVICHTINGEYPCIYCGELFHTEQDMKEHITNIHLLRLNLKRVTQSELIILDDEQQNMIAKQQLDNCSSISQHVLKTLVDSRQPTDLFPESSSIKDTLIAKKKYKLRNGKVSQVCNYCSKKFDKLSDLERHVRMHTGEKPFKCDICNKCFAYKSVLNVHMKTHIRVNDVVCHMCGHFFSTKTSLKIHMRLHIGSKPFKCILCPATFRTSGHCKLHVQKHEAEEARSESCETASNNRIKKRIYNKGNKGGNSEVVAMTMAANIQSESSKCGVTNKANEDNKCIYCNNIFEKKFQMILHMTSHLEDGPFTCHLCLKRFDQIIELKVHMLSHTNARSCFACIHCGIRVTTKQSLKKHLEKYHTDDFDIDSDIDIEDEDCISRTSSSSTLGIEQNSMFEHFSVEADKPLDDFDSVIQEFFLPVGDGVN